MKDLQNSKWHLNKKMKTTDFNFPIIIGDMLHMELKPDVPTTVYVVHKVIDIEEDKTIRIECINSECKKADCTYVNLYDFEISKVYIDNKYEKSQKLGGITF